MHKTSPAPRGAFTLIEMLVVIGIIALLAAISFPVFSKVRENGRKTVCASNLRSLGQAFALYTQDSAGRYPFAGNYQRWASADNTNAAAAWVTGGSVTDLKPAAGEDQDKYALASGTAPFTTNDKNQALVERGALFPYVKTASVYMCPSAPDVNKKKLSYSMNCALAGIPQSRIRPGAATEVVLLIDEGNTLNDGFFWATGGYGNTATDALFNGHNGGGNLLFTDGHVKFFTLDKLHLDGTGSKTEVGSGIYLKSTMTGPVRFHDPAFGPNGSNVIPVLQSAADAANPANWKNTCFDPVTATK